MPKAAATWLEIGFGGGEHLLEQARRNPQALLIGCEPYEDGVIKVLTAIEDDGLKNIRVHMGDVRDVLRQLAPGSLIALSSCSRTRGRSGSTASGGWLILRCSTCSRER